MHVQPRWSKKTDQLVRYVAQQCQPSLQSDLGQWIHSQPRFGEFVATHQDKIRKKLTTAADREVRLDVRAELLVAYRVLGDRRFEVAFEASGAVRGGPDLTLRYRSNTLINLEVTRLRSAAEAHTVASIVASKVRQLPAGVHNAVVIVGTQVQISDALLALAMRHLKARAESKDDAFFARRGLRDAGDFHARLLRLSGIFVLNQAGASVYMSNREGRHPIPDEPLAHLSTCLGIIAPVHPTAMTPSVQPVVHAVSSSATHTMAKPNRDCIHLLEGIGVRGDAHAGETVKHRSRVARNPTEPNLRQVHLIHAELLTELRASGFEVHPGCMGENITTSGLDLLGLPAGTRLKLGESAVLEITGLRNPCRQLDGIQPRLMSAVLDKDASGPLIRKAGVMAIVLASGDIRPGDAIQVELPREPHHPLECV